MSFNILLKKTNKIGGQSGRGQSSGRTTDKVLGISMSLEKIMVSRIQWRDGVTGPESFGLAQYEAQRKLTKAFIAGRKKCLKFEISSLQIVHIQKCTMYIRLKLTKTGHSSVVSVGNFEMMSNISRKILEHC